MSVRIRIRRRRTVAAGAAAALAGLAFAATPAPAADPDYARITTPPSISGEAVVGETLTAVDAAWETNLKPVVTFRWVRCADNESSTDCSLIDGAMGTSYTLTDEDLGQHLLSWLQVRSGKATASALSEPTAAIAERPEAKPEPEPSPEPEPEPSPEPAPEPSPQPTVSPVITDLVPPDTTTPAPPATGAVAGQQADALKWLSPFPVVRIKGWLTATGARVTMLTVRAPRGARISVRCKGEGCPRKRYARMTRLVHLKPYQRLLRGTMRLEISVTRRGFVGKRTVITLRKGKAPARRDLCLYPGVRRAKACKAA